MLERERERERVCWRYYYIQTNLIANKLSENGISVWRVWVRLYERDIVDQRIVADSLRRPFDATWLNDAFKKQYIFRCNGVKENIGWGGKYLHTTSWMDVCR